MDSKDNSGRGGRGRFGRGGRGMGRSPARTGTIPTIGVYLDLIPGKDVNPGAVMNWMVKISEYSMTQCESKIYSIFGSDGTLGEYPDIKEPTDPPEDCTRVIQKKWEVTFSDYNKDKNKLDLDKGKLFGIMIGQMSENSKNRVKETVRGTSALEKHDPRELLGAILSTHMGDNRLGADHNLFKIQQAFAVYTMQPGDHLPYYHQRFRALLSGLNEAYKRAGREKGEDKDPDFKEAQLALKFTLGLNSSYHLYKQYFEDGIKEWPISLAQAFSEASRFKLRSGNSYSEGAGRSNTFAMRGRFGGRGRGRGGRGSQGRYSPGRSRDDSPGRASGAQSVYGTRKGECHNCGQSGHYAYECKSENGGGSAGGSAGGHEATSKQKGK
jgi:Zinc knuckle